MKATDKGRYRLYVGIFNATCSALALVVSIVTLGILVVTIL
jgi:hypothetical protein